MKLVNVSAKLTSELTVKFDARFAHRVTEKNKELGVHVVCLFSTETNVLLRLLRSVLRTEACNAGEACALLI